MKSLRILSGFRQMKPRRTILILAVTAALLVLTGCAETGQMVDQPRYDPLQAGSLFSNGSSAREMVPGTVPYSAEDSPNNPVNTGLDENGDPLTGFPVTVDEALLKKGQERYGIFCTPCHGLAGEGNGKAVTFGVPKPPSLLENARTLKNGELFNIITNGQGKMFPYGYRVKTEERWAVIAYLRALQLKDGKLKLEELTPADIEQIGQQQ